jgi:predicted ATPase/signal transduction histidine kinase/tRNA A-37 threonylcarbamoyl transferase component Bud32
MMKLTNYTITETIYEGFHSIVYRGYRNDDNCPVIIKTLESQYPNPKQIARFHHEYEISKDLNLDGIIKTYGLEKSQNHWLLIFEDIQGDSLKNVLATNSFDLISFLKIAISLAEGLGELHAHNIIHKDIKPANIIVNLETGIVKITDFSISASLENQTVAHNLLEGTFLYISPEQTGRMNRAVDYRTDFYSLGIVFYEILVGHPPFENIDAMELVHCHIAKTPTPPNQINPAIPEMISFLIMKLLEKTADARYQSTYGLKVDLQTCLQGLENTGEIERFALAIQDFSEKFKIPQKLYGRYAELAHYQSLFEKVSEGSTEIMLVTGYSGIGKSALVQEIYKPITQKRGYFISGKFDQLQRNIPYSAIIDAFADLVRQLLTETETRLQQWREKLLAALESNGQVIIDVIPEVELIIGKQPAVQILEAQETQNRFHFVFQKFLCVFCQAKHPLVLFLDDLQWEDSATLKLVETIIGGGKIPYLFFIGAYRNVNATHPLMMSLDSLQKQGIALNQINLKPLSFESVAELIADTLHYERINQVFNNNLASLIDLVLQKTQGNPFFINQFLETLSQENLLRFEMKSRRWQWDIAQIEKRDITDNVIDLMIHKLKKLPVATQHVLHLAACIGNHFDLYILSIISEKSQAEIYQDLLSAVIDGLILPTSELEADESGQFIVFNYKFLHDRIQQAAYALIDDDQKKAVHLKIGQLLLANTPSEKQFEKIFEQVNHLNQAQTLITSSDDKLKLAKLNVKAGKNALLSSAFEVAYGYFSQGIALLPSNHWKKHYSLALDLYQGAAEAACLNTDFDRMKKILDVALPEISDIMDKIKFYQLLLLYYHTDSQFRNAVETAVEILAQLGEKFPAKPDSEDFIAALTETYQWIEKIDFKNLPKLQNPQKLAALTLLRHALYPAYFAVPKMLGLLICRMVKITLQYGESPLTPIAFSAFSVLLNGGMSDIPNGAKFGELAIQYYQRDNDPYYKASVFNFYFGLSRHFYKPIKESIAPLLEGYQSFTENGDAESSAYCLINSYVCSLLAGQNLNNITKEFEPHIQYAPKLKQAQVIHQLYIWRQVIDNLTDESAYGAELKGKWFDAEKMLPLLYEGNNLNTFNYGNVAQLLLYYTFDQYEKAYLHAHKTELHLAASTGKVFIPSHNFYYSLTLAALYPTAQKKQEEYLEKIKANQKQMKIWADHCPENFSHKYLLVEAEIARISDKALEAMDLYDQAIASARKNEFVQNEALANELATKFWLKKDKEEFASLYMTKAYYGYQQWGAKRKFEDLQEKYPDLITTPQKFTSNTTTTTTHFDLISSQTLITSLMPENTLDLSTVMKASQAISSEIVLKQLIKKFMHILMENVGAEKGWLILKETGETEAFFVKARATVTEVQILDSVPLELEVEENAFSFSKAIIAYTMRMQQILVLNDATHSELFANDSTILQQQSKSVLCFQILYKNQMVGLFYFENNLTKGAFTSDRLAVLKMLSTQIAISLENAQTMATLDAKVVERTCQLNTKVEELICTRNHLVQSEKMASLGRLVAGFAHELNTPIGVAVGAASMLQENANAIARLLEQDEVDEDDLIPILETVDEAANLTLSNLKRAAGLVSSFKRTAVDQTSEEVRRFVVKSTLSYVVKTLNSKFKRTTIEIQIDCPDDLAIHSVPGALEQILTNLIMNSLIHGFDEGKKSGYIKIAIRLEGEILHFDYSDTGKGIAPETIKKIFEPFFTTHRAHGGSGLGLYICYNIVTTQLNGTISCESAVGKGVIFRIAFPV